MGELFLFTVQLLELKPPLNDASITVTVSPALGDNGKLTEVYIRRIMEISPTFFVLENVPGLLRTTKHRTFLVELMERLSKAYAIDINILNSLDFGVPQDRERVFVIGFKKNFMFIVLLISEHSVGLFIFDSN